MNRWDFRKNKPHTFQYHTVKCEPRKSMSMLKVHKLLVYTVQPKEPSANKTNNKQLTANDISRVKM